MEYLPAYNRILKEGGIIALSTSANNNPNVRIVNYCFDENNPSVLYFSTSSDSNKIAELTGNEKTAFTTIPTSHDDTPHVRSHNAFVRKSDLSLNDVKDMFLKQTPDLAEMFEAVGNFLDIYEIHVKEADVVVSMEDAGIIIF
ncbi:hypothetical protein MmiEs2_11210 [Methanimicrococcus stummii]|uniref:Pyridoxamine 5'-phosphate oxidase-like domain-containing protein n=1 Tax=Methanimicrococcus stummii TaxID=3028294 RepID=A0AA96VBL5_9EURY|nr:pyridoxamine 5'-phosphate oxidase family protein [Methanimicrococcus sp. Es2]WNY28908.1 hypothetical protein MmiEs2_11210 [Methanimicrococcus sp. Es2]